MSASLDVLAVVDVEPRIVSLEVGEPGEITITVLFDLDGSTISLSFDPDRFLALVEQLRRFAETDAGEALLAEIRGAPEISPAAFQRRRARHEHRNKVGPARRPIRV